MTTEQLFESIGSLDDDLLERSEQKITPKPFPWRWIAVAACAFLVIGLAIWSPSVSSPHSEGGEEETPVEEAPVEEAQRPAMIQEEGSAFAYNILWGDVLVASVPSECAKVELDAQDMEAYLPEELPAWAQCNGTAWINDLGETEALRLNISTQTPGVQVELLIGCPWNEQELAKDVDASPPYRTRCADTEYTLYYNAFYMVMPYRITLTATTNSNGIERVFYIAGSEDLIEQAQADFEELLIAFAQWKPEQSVVDSLKNEGEALDSDAEKPFANNDNNFDEKLCTYQQATDDVKYGRYIPSELPGKYFGDYLRIQNEWEDSLIAILHYWDVSGNWANGEGELYSIEWRVCDEPFVGVNGFAAEELSLERIKEHLHEAEYKPGSYRLSFYVDYGDAYVQIYALDIEPETVYELLKQIR